MMAARLRGTAHAARNRDPEILGRVRALLTAPAARDVVLAGIDADDPTLRRASFELAVRAGHGEFPELLWRAWRWPDPALRYLAAAEALRQLRGPELRAVVARLLRDPGMGMRRLGLAALVEHFTEDVPEVVEAALLDAHVSMRELARFHFQRLHGACDFAALYRQALAGASGAARIGGAIGGLAETGTADDGGAVAAYLGQRAPRVREAAVKGLARLAFDEHLPRVCAAVGDASATVSRAAADALLRRGVPVPAAELARMARDTRHVHVRRNVARLLAQRSGMGAIAALLELCVCEDESVASLVRELVVARVERRRTVESGSVNEVRAAGEALRWARGVLPKETVRKLEFMIGVIERGGLSHRSN